MKAFLRNILVGIVCVLILLGIGFWVFAKTSEPKEGVLYVADDVTSAEIVYGEKVYSLEHKQMEDLAEFFRKLKAAEYDIDTGEEDKGIIVKFYVDETEWAKFGITDKETILSYAMGDDATITIYKTETDMETYLLEFIEKIER